MTRNANLMESRRLQHDDVNALRDLVHRRSTIKGMLSEEISLAINYRAKWLEGMQRYYLDGGDTHYLYGCHDTDGQLLSCLGWRCGLPEDWSDGWVVGHLKTRPGHGIVRSGMMSLWREMFRVCEAKGLRRWHMLIPENTRDGYQRVADRFFADVDGTYDYSWSMIIPAGTRPETDWVWGVMGRVEHVQELRLRTGTKKCA
jgi:hypothetical protein